MTDLTIELQAGGYAIVFVYLGKLPKYAILNIRETKVKFPEVSVVLITDLKSNSRRLGNDAIEVLIYKTQNVSDTGLVTEHNMSFRNGFWYKTMARFDYISRFMSDHPDVSVYHFEADNWISPRFPFRKIAEFSQGISYPELTSGDGIASVMYVRSQKEMNYFITRLREEIAQNSFMTDMKFLGIMKKDVSLVSILPSQCMELPPSNCLNGIFDGASHGMFFLGDDPVNHFGAVYLGRNFPNHIVQIPMGSRLIVSKDKCEIWNKSSSIEIFNLHIHSKSIKYFSAVRKLKNGENLILGYERPSFSFSPKALLMSINILFFLAIGRFLRFIKNV